MPAATGALALSLALSLAGCTGYSPKPLADTPAFPQAASALAVPARPGHPFEPADGLDADELATLAIARNPDLRLARLASQVTQAQAFSAGLLPDPVVNLTRDFPDVTGAGISSAFVLGAGYSVQALLTHPAILEAGRADVRQARSALLWQEWQTIAQARLLHVRLQAGETKRLLLERTRSALEERTDRARQALEQGLLSLDTVAPGLTALQDVTRQLSDLRRLSQQARLDLNALLGLAPDALVLLQGQADFPAIDEAAVRADTAALVARRPDLRALRSGYAAQDARYRVALLNQFPALTLGVQRSRDNSNVFTSGFGVNLALPLFNGNRGEVRLQDATRDKLRAEYQQRLNVGAFDIARVLADQRLTQRRLADLDPAVAALRSARDRMREAYRSHNIDAITLATLETATLATEVERLDARQALQEQRIGLLALTGGDHFSDPMASGETLP